ncbi:hypothetical protein [Actimicrobium sp. CCI2.3]|uniref:hypothetical protein n=1 Tax=Actimicrobium sp. CCI2.3 TaxID=3048616 RepID=UPI002AB549F2|nr:hypothetical protein [Actimicrobium sp. CCI2.3]MDY7576450.1 hypothetical protein [Actimicrobium sp. CCI2.3]MEB0021571.1 hypothetical protein [Actimicrobium sp. CCI2.3]
MISDRARESLHQIFLKAARSRLGGDASESFEITQLDSHHAGNVPERDIVVLTISSLLFRLLVILHIEQSDTAPEDVAGPHGNEQFYELVNLCCGAINTELLNHFPDLGMSTPNTLHGHCAAYLDALGPASLTRYVITVNSSLRIGAVLCWCAYAPIDFVYEPGAAEEVTGELELF